MSISSEAAHERYIRKAMTLREAIPVFDPRMPLQGKALDAFYVERQKRPARAKMKVRLEESRETGTPVKLLFTGHVGSGKSTELNKLCTELGDQFFVSNVLTSNLVQPTDLSYVDVVLITATTLFKDMVARGALTRAIGQVAEDFGQNALKFLRERIMGNKVRDPLNSPEVSLKINAIIAEFEARYRTEPNTRKEIKERVAERVSEVLSQIDYLAAEVRRTFGRPLLLVIEGVDKADPQTAEDIFCNHYNTLVGFRAATVYTFPISLYYSPRFMPFKQYYDDAYRLPNMPLYERIKGGEPDLTQRRAKPDADGRSHLHHMLRQRLGDSLITDEARETLIENCGGVARFLISLTNQAAVSALSRGSSTIELEDAEYVADEQYKAFTAQLEQADYAWLAARYQDKELTGDDDTQRLLYSLALLEYENGGVWCDVHPAALRLLRERMPKDE